MSKPKNKCSTGEQTMSTTNILGAPLATGIVCDTVNDRCAMKAKRLIVKQCKANTPAFLSSIKDQLTAPEVCPVGYELQLPDNVCDWICTRRIVKPCCNENSFYGGKCTEPRIVGGENGKANSFIIANACVKGPPPVNRTDRDVKIKCCTGNQTDFQNKCPIGYCPEGKNCYDIMKQVCIEQGINFPECDTYLRDGDCSTRMSIAKDWIKKNYLDPQMNINTNLNTDKTLTELCTNVPGACTDFLNFQCRNFSREDVSQDSNLGNLCGCFLPKTDKNGENNYWSEVPRECDAVCANSVHDGTKCNPTKCDKSVCMVAIDANNIEEWTKGKIDINQNCGGGKGLCYISVSVNDAKKLETKGVKIDQKCTKCTWVKDFYKGTEPGNMKNLNCDKPWSGITGSDNGGNNNKKKGDIKKLAIFIGSLVVLFLVMLALVFLL